MDFNHEFDNRCSFCEQAISFVPVTVFNNDCCFCNLVCAKLYHDHEQQIKPNMHEYHSAYLQKQLSKLSIDIYEKLNGTMFNMLPDSKSLDISDKVEAKNEYTKILLRMK